ncbi:MAG: type 1 periplasmic binding fold superfamily protein [Flammeovirgaceae bacterium]|nr:type 1 periplasmic binding fold superfamily protein [Flammeovirgaceae bacterium]
MKNFSQIKNLILSSIFISMLSVMSCSDDPEDPVIENEEEVITTLTYTLTPSGGGSAVVLQYQDLDGDGPNQPTITNGTLSAETSYSGAMTLLNETESPAESVTEEIEEEDADHQFFFASTVTGLTVAYADTDGDGKPVGLASTLTTGAAGSGNLTVTLKHEPDKSASGVSEGDMTNAGGETDISVTWTITVE